jgi:hypothetical protein
MTINPELADLADRITEAERLVDATRERARVLLHDLTDVRLALDAVVRELHDDDARVATSTIERPALLAALEGGQ